MMNESGALQEHGSQWRYDEIYRMRPHVQRYGLRFRASEISKIRPTVILGIAVKNLFPPSDPRDAKAVVVARYGSEVRDDEYDFASSGLPQETQRALCRIGPVDPLNPAGIAVEF